MTHIVNFKVQIDGTPIGSGYITQVTLHQAFNEHARFELHVYSDRSGDADMFAHDKAKDFLGKDVSIAFNDAENSQADNSFKGIFTEMAFASDYGNAREGIMLSGYGKTIKLDSGPTNSAHSTVKVSDVVSKIINAAGLTASVIATKDVLPYITQYGESNFEFIRRLAAEYGEPFYDDGTKVHFGKTGKGAEITLTYPADLSECNLRVKLMPTNTEQTLFLSKDAKKESGNNKSVSAPGQDAFGKAALTKSGDLFQFLPRTLAARKTWTGAGLQDALKIAKQRVAGSLTVLEAVSDSPFVKVGAIVNITAPGIAGLKYLVTSVQHTFDGTGYSNRFEAVPENIDVIPSPYYPKPVAEPQIGKVVANKDPDSLGRVQVELMWHKDGETTPFIRVMRPDGGGSAKNRGFYFIPEIDDYVIVGFAQNDPDRPFVMGALPTGNVSDTAKYGKKNDYRSISTRSGSIISFEDGDDKNEIRIDLDGANYISILKESSDGTIKIFSSKAIEVNSKETIVVNSGKSIEVQGDKTITVKSEKITVEATDTVTIKANKKIELKAADVAIEASKGLEAKGGATTKIEGLNTEISGSVKTAVKGGAQLELQASGAASLKGAIVQIN